VIYDGDGLAEIPFVAAGTWEDRITAILVMPFIAVALLAGIAIYLWMLLRVE
jgi:hypothetical protein